MEPRSQINQLRVLLVGKASPERGGIPSFLEMLVERLPGAGIEVDLLNLADADQRTGGSVSGSNLAATGRDLARLVRTAAEFDVVHVHSACAPGPTLVRAGALCAVARLRHARPVLHVHGGRIADWLHGRLRTRLARVALAGVEQVVAVASEPADTLAAALGRPVPLIPNGVDLDRFHPTDAPSGRPRPSILMVGGLTPRKGVLDLLEASADVRRRGIDHELLLAGGTPDDGSATHQRVTAAIAAAGPHVTVVPPIPHDEMADLYRRADVFCLPSWWEAQPLSLLEAMACGVASVATDVGDVRVMTDDGAAAKVVPVRDVPALSDALASLLTDPVERSGLAAAGRRRVEDDRNVDAVVDAVIDVYRTTNATDLAEQTDGSTSS